MNKQIINTIEPLAPYIGGKVKLSKTIIPKIEAIPHTIYAEPFVGMGGIFFRRTKPASAEAINDIGGDLVNLFRIVQRFPKALMEHLKYQLTARGEFQRQKNIPPQTLTDIERAARFLYLQATTFGGKTGGTFGVSKSRSARFNYIKMQNKIEKAAERLASVTIENLDFEDFITRYDSPQTLFYLDPPYYKCEHYYGKNIFKREDFTRIAKILATIEGNFILSINDTPQIRETFKTFQIEQVSLKYSVASKPSKNKLFHELIISNERIKT
jgi:DNA adenine methylase